MKSNLMVFLILPIMSVVVFSNYLCADSKKIETKQPLFITEDFEKAKEISVAYQLPLVLVFTGSDWCPHSKKLLEDVFCQPSFKAEMNKDFVFVKIDFPELAKVDEKHLSQNASLKTLFEVEEFPTLVLFDVGEEFVGKIGFKQVEGNLFAKNIRNKFLNYRSLGKRLCSIENSEKLYFSELKNIYSEAKAGGFDSYVERALTLSDNLTEEDSVFFLLEKYKQEFTNEEKSKSLEELIIKRDPKDKQGVRLKLAILDYQRFVGEHPGDSEKALEPLIGYAKKKGLEGDQDSWRVHLFIAQELARHGDWDHALFHANESLESAPYEMQPQLKKMIKHLDIDIVAHSE